MQVIFTSAAANYAPKVALLYESVKRHHPDSLFVQLAVERHGCCDAWKGKAYDDVLYVDDLTVGRDPAWLFSHTIVELATAVKPAALLALLDRPGCDSVTYIDPDIVLFSPIDEVLRFADGEGAILTPHLCKPEATPRGVMDHEISCLKHGLYNLGFLSVACNDRGRAVARWWAERVEAHCDADTTTGLFTDQKWMDFLPIFFDGVRVEKSPRFNVAPWNIAQRRLRRDGERWNVDGQPLGFYHFTGFDSGAHEAVLAHYGKDSPDIGDLVAWYKREQALRLAALGPLPRWSYSVFSDGAPVSPLHRRIYRRRPDLQHAFPDPFAVPATGACYRRWFDAAAASEHPDLFGAEPMATASGHTGVGRSRSWLRRMAAQWR